MIRIKNSLLALAITACAAIFSPHQAAAAPCEQVDFEGAAYVICTLDLRKADLRLFWKTDDGTPYRTFSNLSDTLAAKGKTLTFALNAGMYDTDFSPMGLYVEDGRELVPAHRAQAPQTGGTVPNFFKKPNGVFFIDAAGHAQIVPTESFTDRRPKARIATQSGPMLVIDNKLNPIFIAGSADRTRRSGVGACTDDTVRFAISDDSVNFETFARLFRDELKCPNALFLDGGRGVGIFDPALGRNDRSWHGGYGPIFALVE